MILFDTLKNEIVQDDIPKGTVFEGLKDHLVFTEDLAGVEHAKYRKVKDVTMVTYKIEEVEYLFGFDLEARIDFLGDIMDGETFPWDDLSGKTHTLTIVQAKEILRLVKNKIGTAYYARKDKIAEIS